ncbi:MAG: ATP-binding cassette domain-containing protein [Megasphaera sp.]|jgi:peptide/nickel transport system ATP-binding protein|nr:ATP-binding cassette domain-containing protein [Megasphaera sp.]MCI1822541.1 ATP-binding cassette domain-containing protein [Megasphaera sp.]
MSTILSFQDVTVTDGNRVLLDALRFTVCKGEILVIVGESGSGKTTLLKAASGMISPPLQLLGKVCYKGRALQPSDWQKVYGYELSILFQDALSSFCPVQTIQTQLWDAVRLTGNMSHSEFTGIVKERAVMLGLPEESLHKYPITFSGGMIQRAELLFPLIMPPHLLLADEPTSAVDSLTQQKIADALLRLRRYHQTAIIFVTHDIRLARYMADTLLVLKQGHLIEYGKASNVIKNPQQPYTKELLFLAGIRKDC